jgi:16S rRNA (cytosine967-C5)-methyltransferase
VEAPKPREFAARALRLADQPGDFIENRLEHIRGFSELTEPDRRLAMELTFGVIRWRDTLQWLVDQKRGDNQSTKPGLDHLLHLGLYQLFWLDRVPDHAAVNETVELAHRLGFRRQAGYINAVLRNYVREKEATRAAIERLKKDAPATGFSHPAWLVDRWRKQTGDADLLKLLEWNNTPPATFARINPLRLDPAKLLERWRLEENVDYEFFLRDWTGENLMFELKSHPPLGRLPTFQEGGFYIQDPSTVLPVRMLDPQPGETVLDLCAAPGGKTTLIAQFMQNQGTIIANDASPPRLKMLKENCRRLGVDCVKLSKPDDLSTIPPDSVDRLLLDAPCSNTGVMRRRVQLRWRLKSTEIERLAGQQATLLNRWAGLVRPGGVVVYATCSLEPDENAAVVQAFLAANAGFQLEEQRELVPWRDGVDGAFAAKLRRER